MINVHFDRTTQLAIQKTLMTIKLQEGKSITKFIEDFQGAFHEAATSRLTIDDAQLVIFLLAKLLPTSHQPFISTHGHDTTLTFPTIISKFFQEEVLTKTTLENANILAFFVNNKRRFNNKRSSFNNFPKGGANASPQEPTIEKDKSMIKCYSCHKKKHFASKCKTQTKDRANVNFQKSYPNILNKPIQAPLKILQYQKFICILFTKMEIVKSKILGSFSHELATI
jgi:hypothetical protein